MFYTIEKIDNHPCYTMQRILEVFFFRLSEGNIWDIHSQHEELLRVHGRSNFVSLLEDLYNDLLPINTLVRGTINHQFLNNNNIENLCNNTLNLEENIQWYILPIKKIKDFFIDCYPDKLDLGIFKRAGCPEKPTKRFYQDFIEQNGHICPFCSILPHKHPFGKKRADFDHYLDKAHYPMSALNLDNLIPMCSECNQDYKHTHNVLKTDAGMRRGFIYPYDIKEAFKIEVINIILEDMSVTFEIEIITDIDPDLKSSFDDVFHITERMKRELRKRYYAWLSEKAKCYILVNTDVNVIGFKEFLLNTAENVINLEDRTLEAKLLEHALYLYLANAADDEINDIFLHSYLFEDIT